MFMARDAEILRAKQKVWTQPARYRTILTQLWSSHQKKEEEKAVAEGSKK